MRYIALLLILLLSGSFQGTKFYRTKIGKQVSILLPGDFVLVPPEEISTKFISYRPSLAVYTNMTTEIDFGINTSVSRWRSEDIELVRSFYKSNIISLYDDVQFIREEIKPVNKRNFVIFEFISKINPEDKSAIRDTPVIKYTFIQYSLVKGTVYIFDFSSPADQQEIWRPVVTKIMESVKIK